MPDLNLVFLSELYDDCHAEFEKLATREQLSSVPFSSRSYAERVLPIHLDQTTDQATRRTQTMDYLFKVFTEWGLILKDKKVLELHAGPIGVAPLVGRYGGTHYLGLEVNEHLVHYANENSSRQDYFSWCTEDTSSYLKSSQTETDFDIVFALYEVLNTYTEPDCHALVQALGRRLKKGGCVVGDVRTWRQSHGGYSMTLHRSSDRIRVDEVGNLPEKEMVAHRTTSATTSGILHEEYNCLRLIQPAKLDTSFASAGFKLVKSGFPLLSIDTDVSECRDNYFFIYKKIL